jgi:hypothetical protein
MSQVQQICEKRVHVRNVPLSLAPEETFFLARGMSSACFVLNLGTYFVRDGWIVYDVFAGNAQILQIHARAER